MSLAYKKIDGGEHWIYRSRFKMWQILLIGIAPLLVGSVGLSLMPVIRVVAILFGIIFCFVYGMSGLPMHWAFRRTIKEGKQIMAEKKDGYYQYSIPK